MFFDQARDTLTEGLNLWKIAKHTAFFNFLKEYYFNFSKFFHHPGGGGPAPEAPFECGHTWEPPPPTPKLFPAYANAEL